MSASILGWSLVIAQIMLTVAVGCAAWRVAAGPRAQDRVLGLDTLYMNVMMLMITYGIRYGTTYYFEAAVIIGLTGFVATAALAKFLMRGEVIE